MKLAYKGVNLNGFCTRNNISLMFLRALFLWQMNRGRFQKKSISTAVHHHVHDVTCSCSLNKLSFYISFVRALKNIAFVNAMFLLPLSLFCWLFAHIFTYFSPHNAISPHFHNTFISLFLCASCAKQQLQKFCSTIYLSQQWKRFHLSTFAFKCQRNS